MGFLVCAAPLALYKAAATGSPLADVARYNLLTHLGPGLDPWRIHRMLEPPEPLGYLAAHPGAVIAKIVRHLPALAWAAVAQGGLAFAALFLAWLVRPGSGHAAASVRATLVAAFAIAIGLVAVTLPDARYLAPLLPLVVGIAVAAIPDHARRLRLGPSIALLVGVALVALGPGWSTASQWLRAASRPVVDRGGFLESEWRALGAGVAARVAPGTVIASDVGPWIVWYARRPVVLIPNDPEEMPALSERLPVGAVVLTNHWLIGQPGSETWKALYFGQTAWAGWARVDSVAAGRLRAVILKPERS
jgi:hypothetical protein